MIMQLCYAQIVVNVNPTLTRNNCTLLHVWQCLFGCVVDLQINTYDMTYKLFRNISVDRTMFICCEMFIIKYFWG